MNRKCNSCQACCTHLNIPELSKPAGTKCEHLTSKGCGIYQDRPPPCRKFVCAWLDGAFDEKSRPDRLGLVIAGGPTDFGVGIICFETRDKAASTRASKHIIRTFNKRLPVLVVKPDQSAKGYNVNRF